MVNELFQEGLGVVAGAEVEDGFVRGVEVAAVEPPLHRAQLEEGLFECLLYVSKGTFVAVVERLVGEVFEGVDLVDEGLKIVAELSVFGVASHHRVRSRSVSPEVLVAAEPLEEPDLLSEFAVQARCVPALDLLPDEADPSDTFEESLS